MEDMSYMNSVEVKIADRTHWTKAIIESDLYDHFKSDRIKIGYIFRLKDVAKRESYLYIVST